MKLINLKNLKTKFLGRNAIHYKKIDSTQNKIWSLIEEGAASGTLVMADIQTKGQGTHGRVWHTDEKNNIAFSFFVKLDCNVEQIEGITIKIAQIIVNVLKKMYGINLEIKFPNDIVFNNKKIGGILTQTKILGEKVKYLVIGIGINTEQQEFCDEIKDIATSIKKEFGIDVNTYDFISEFCNEFEDILERINKI